MAGYRRVNYYELCRLCTSSEGTKMHIFREEGRRRQLPTKIQICLPLQLVEDDSLPKIICSHCVDKLESFYDFRESCVNAEAMLESYFTSLRYSNDFTREGKVSAANVYVKDESPPKKKAAAVTDGVVDKLAAPKQLLTDGLNSLVQAASIQIVSDEEGTRVQQYKCQLQQMGAAQSAVLESETRYSYEPCVTNQQRVADNKVEDGSTQCSETDFNAKQQLARHQEQTPESSDGDLSNQQQPIRFTTTDPTASQMLVHFNFKNEVDVDPQALQRSSMAHISEFLRLKSDVVMETAVATVNMPMVQSRFNCERCSKSYTCLDDFQTHVCEDDGEQDQDGMDGDKTPPGCSSYSGNFSCEICSKPFKRKEHLFQHRKLHTGERPYICTACGKAFSRKEHLVRHAVSHTGQKTHACDTCGKTFSRKDNLHKHRKTHGIAGPYICETCGKSFVVKHYYLMHKNSHASSTDPADPNAPATAEGGEMHKCDVCSKSFTSKSYLTSHRARHKKTAAVKYEQETQHLLSRLTEGQHQLLAGSQPLTTINNAALLAPNILHHAGVELGGAQTTAYLCATAPSELIETYRRLHPST